MPLAFGLIDKDKLNLPYEQLINEIDNAVAMFSYSPSTPPDFLGFFQYLTSYFQDCEETGILEKLTDSLSSIAGYKLGLRVAEVFLLAENIILKLLANPNINSMKIAVDYARKVSRVIGPRLVIQKFVIPNVNNIQCRRGLTIMATLAITDHPKFNFVEEDFDKSWVGPLSEIVGVGPRLISAIKAKIPQYSYSDSEPIQRPPSVPVKFNFIKQMQNQDNQSKESDTIPNRRNPPNTARPPLPPRIIRKQKPLNPNGHSSSPVFHFTNRQQQIREFVDEPFEDTDECSAVFSSYLQQCRTLLKSSDWEERSAGYNQAKRILRYATPSFTDEDFHQIVTVASDDVGSQRAALALSSVGAITEAFLKAPQAMAFELGRILPVLLKLHQKNAQYFECALNSCFDAMIQNLPPKRFLSVLVPNCDSKSAKVQIAVAKSIKLSLERVSKSQRETSETDSQQRVPKSASELSSSSSQEKFFSKKSGELINLIAVISKLSKAPASESREAAKDAAAILYDIYGDDLDQIVFNALQPRDAAEFQKFY